MTYYVYYHCRPDGTPFYVGKGSGGRAWDVSRGRSRHHAGIVTKYGAENISIVVLPCESEADAFAHEKDFIKAFRLFGYELTNQTNKGISATAKKNGEAKTNREVEQNPLNALGDRLVQLRRDRGWTQKRLCAVGNLSQGHVSRIEAGLVGVCLDTLAALADAFNIELSEMLEGVA